jgi:HEAT repeat protein
MGAIMVRRIVGAVLLLFAVGCGRTESTETLLKNLSDPDSAVRLNAVKRLGHRTSEAEKIARLLAERLQKDEDLYVRRDSANALAELGAAAKPAWAALVEAARKDREPRVRKVAAAALKKIDSDSAAREGFH